MEGNRVVWKLVTIWKTRNGIESTTFMILIILDVVSLQLSLDIMSCSPDIFLF